MEFQFISELTGDPKYGQMVGQSLVLFSHVAAFSRLPKLGFDIFTPSGKWLGTLIIRTEMSLISRQGPFSYAFFHFVPLMLINWEFHCDLHSFFFAKKNECETPFSPLWWACVALLTRHARGSIRRNAETMRRRKESCRQKSTLEWLHLIRKKMLCALTSYGQHACVTLSRVGIAGLIPVEVIQLSLQRIYRVSRFVHCACRFNLFLCGVDGYFTCCQ